MAKPWESVLTLSVIHFMAYPETMLGSGPVAETLEKLAMDEFFGGAEITWIKDADVRAKVRSISKQSGLRLGFGAQPILLSQKLSLNDLDEAGRKSAVAAIQGAIDEAAEMGCARVAVLTGPDPGDAARERGLDALAASMNTLCRYGDDKGVGMTIETFDRDVDKKSILGPSPMCAEFAARVREDFPTFGLMYDLSHMPLLNERADEALPILKDYLVHMHVGNCVKIAGKQAYGDEHPRFGYPNSENDVAELAEFLAVLFDIGYLDYDAEGPKPWLGIEVKPQPEETSDLMLAQTKRTWRQAWSLLP